MPTDQFLQVTLYFGAPDLNRGFLCIFPICRTTAVQGLIWCRKTCRMTELDTFALCLQVQNIREANMRMVLQALEQPNREVEQLIKEQKDKYNSKYTTLSFISVTCHVIFCSLNWRSFLHSSNNPKSIVFLSTDCDPGDKDEPDLPALATLDFAALKDIRQTGAEYCCHYEALLHNTPGLQPGYLLEEESRHLVTGVSNFSSHTIIFQFLVLALNYPYS